MTAPRHRPNLAAVLIVRDEAANLSTCLASVGELVDEIRVHDTGSTDATFDIAIRHGAVVTRGPWTGDFATARNAALAGNSTEWVLSIDADERAVADPVALRETIKTADVDVFEVEIDNLSDEMAYTYHAGRLFRQTSAIWSGRVHEELVGRTRELRTARLPRSVLSLSHVGYQTAALRHDKALRNAEVSRAVLDELAAAGTTDPVAVARALLDLGRSFVGAGRKQDAVDTFEALRALCPGTDEWIRGTDALARLLLGDGMDEVVLHLTGELRNAGVAEVYCDWLACQALAQLGRVEEAADLLSRIDVVVDTAGRHYDPAALVELKKLMGELRYAN